MADKRKSSKAKVNVEVVRVGSNNYVLFRPSDIYPGLRDKTALHIGNLDTRNNVFTPTSTYFELTKDYKEGIVFPEDWILKNVEISNHNIVIKPSSNDTPSSKVSSEKSGEEKAKSNKTREKEELSPELKTIASQINNNSKRQISFGGTWLLYQIALKLGIVEDLMKVFGDDREKVNRILALSWFTLMESDNYDNADVWQDENFLLTRAYLDYDRVIQIFSSVTEEDCERFMLLRQQRLIKEVGQENISCLCLQTTSHHRKVLDPDNSDNASSKEDFNFYKDVVFYALPQTQGLFLNGYVFDVKTPFYYAYLQSDFSDEKTNALEFLNVIEKVGLKDIENFCLVCDCGEDAISDLDPLLSKGIKFQTRIDRTQADIKRIIREDFPQPDDPLSKKEPSQTLFDPNSNEYFYQEVTLHKIKGESGESEREVSLKTTVKLNTDSQEDWINQISNDLAEQTKAVQKAVDLNIKIPDIESFEKDCYLLKFDYDKETGTIKNFHHNFAKINEEVQMAGFEAFRTFGFEVNPDQVNSLDLAYMLQEYVLWGLKGSRGNNRFVGNEKEAHQGKRLTTFISLILNHFLEKMMDENDLFRLGVEPSDLLNKVNLVYATQRNNKIYFAGKDIARYQQILKALGAELPKGVRLDSSTK